MGINELRRGSSYSNSDYLALEKIFEGQIEPDDVLVDVGCGVGRVLTWWVRRAPGQRIYGVEFDPELADTARRRLRRHPNVTVLTGDATAILPEDATLFFLYNTFFGEEPWGVFSENLLRARAGDTRVRVLCHNCTRGIAAFRQSGAWDLDVHDLGGDEAAPLGQLAVMRMRAAQGTGD